MDKKDNSLFVAYLVFLNLCLVYRLVCSFVPRIQFELWDRIIIGVTISSYFFTLSSGVTMRGYYNMVFHHQLDDSASRIVAVSEKYINAHPDDELLTEDEKELRDSLKDIRQHQLDIVLCGEKDKGNRSDKAIFLDVLGFLVFLLCLTFQPISDFCKKEQDIYTLCAFILMLCTMYNKERFERRIDRQAKENKMMLYRITALCEIYEKERIEKKLMLEDK